VLVTPVLHPVSSVTHRSTGELLLAHDNPALKSAICHAQECDDRRVIEHVQERDVFLGTYLSVIEHAQELDVYCHNSSKSPVEQQHQHQSLSSVVGGRRCCRYESDITS